MSNASAAEPARSGAPGAAIRVVIIDDSSIARRSLASLLAAEPGLAVVGTLGDPCAAVDGVVALAPDVVTLDVEMPGRNGLEVLADLRIALPQLPVIMLSAFTQRGSPVATEALARGAIDCVLKPPAPISSEAAADYVRAQLVPRIRAFARPGRVPRGTTMRPPPSHHVDLVAIAASTGGPDALATVFAALPASLAAGVVVVQHMPPTFTRMLAERFDASCPLGFAEARTGDRVVPGRVLIAPGDHHMRVVREAGELRVVLDRGAPVHSCRPAADVLFASVAEVVGPRTLAVVLTGMGQDGLAGCRAIHARGGAVIAQDEATSVVWGMPGLVARAGLGARVLPLPDIARAIEARVAASRPLGAHA